ncbi:MAP kinase [Favolaschia claudopus]|uniref:MAP kinase n=1 Tax=Favolaschia claudopus TaxID=2862362 RepID=A0AAW0EJ87_9AGAR
MSEAGRRPRKVQLYVANPGSDSDDDGPRHPYRYNRPPLPPAPPFPLSTRLKYPSSSSHPSLSSPSTTSDPAHDDSTQSTPPPSTPGLVHEESSPDRTDIRSFPHPPLRPPSPKASRDPVADRVLILVTADSERYVNVDISGATNPAFIRECVFTKVRHDLLRFLVLFLHLSQLNIFDEEDQAHFSIYRTEIGSFATSEALSDDRLFDLCREFGDDKGSLKLLVSHSSARVHEPPPRPPSSLSPTSTFVPPFIPFTHAPLQPRRRRSRSRAESSSSASENHQPDTTDYDADHEPDSRHTNGLLAPNGGPQPHSASPLPSRSSSPFRPPLLYDKLGNLVPIPPPPPPLSSPNRATFPVNDTNDNDVTPPGTQIRVPSDAADREEEARNWRNRQRTRLDTSARRPRGAKPWQNGDEDSPAGYSDSWIMVPNNSNDSDHPPTPVDSRHSPDTRNSPASASAARARQQLSPNRYKAPSSPYRSLAIPAAPRKAPPPVPAASPESRIPGPSRLPGQPVPGKWLVAYKGPDRGGSETKAMPTHSTTWHRLTKGHKSMDNLRGHASIPANLQPGGGRSARAPPLPPTPLLPSGTPTSALGTPKSYDGRTVRPLPIQGSSHPTAHEYSPGQSSYSRGSGTPSSSSTLMSPNNEPYPRPQSAFGDTVMSPNQQRYRPPFQTSGFGSNLDSGSDYGRSPRAPSPPHAFPTSLPYRASRPVDPRHDRHSDPLQSPGSPRSPRFHPNPHPRDQHPGSSSSANELPEITTGMSESSRWAERLFAESDAATLMPQTLTLMPEASTVIPDAATVYSSSSTLSRSNTMISTESYESDDSDEEMWKIRPTAERPKSSLRGPALTVETNSTGLTKGTQQHATFAPGSTPASQQRPRSPSPVSKPKRKEHRTTFMAREEDTWAPRPPPEDVYERLEDFFPQHDLDKPVIEMISGGNSPTASAPDQTLAHAPPTPALVENKDHRVTVRGKKSIRLVAQERKRIIDRTSKMVPEGGLTAIQRKRSTKLWGSKVEEMDTSNSPESPSTTDGPTTFKWVRGELIGRGTYGKVYLALNASTGEMIAVKQVEIPRTASDKNDSRQVTVVQALKLESETLKVLDHPNIVQYLGFEETPTHLSIFLEYVPGGSIGSCLLKHGRFDEDVTKSFTSQILAGLEYLHSKGILHRDLKSDNILVETSGICKISDFGISKRTDDQNDAHTAMQGTVFWMAPEVINTQKKGYSFKIDIWSIGCVVLEMWAGTRPWGVDEVVAVMFKLFQSKLPPPVPEGLELTPLADDFRTKCFAINPEERPSAAELRKHPYLTLSPGWVFDGFASKSSSL